MKALAASALLLLSLAPPPPDEAPRPVFGYRSFAGQARLDARFLAVPDARRAGEELKTLTAEPHLAGSPEDRKTAEYVAGRFREAGLETSIVSYRVLLNTPGQILVEASDAQGRRLMSGPAREHVDGDPYQDDPRVVTPFHGSSGSGEATAEVVYANYGRPEDFRLLEEKHIPVAGRIVLVRYGENFRGVKAYLAQQRGAAGVILYSDPADDGYARGDIYPRGPYRPATAAQRGAVQFLMQYPGDPETPGFASTPELPDSRRLRPEEARSQPAILSTPLSYQDAAPILAALGGPAVPHSWQGALPFTYHLGGDGAVKVHLLLRQNYRLTTIWDVVGRIPGEDNDHWVIAGNHRDAWVYGAVDPGSGTAALLEAARGVGSLLGSGWRPRRTILFASWDAEEEGLIGSTEWAEDHAAQLAQAVGYFNTDMAVSGPDFEASAVPSLGRFLREVTREVPSPAGGTVYDGWQAQQQKSAGGEGAALPAPPAGEVHLGNLGSGSDYTPFFQHFGVPSTDISSRGPYGVYHSVFDNYRWFVANADPSFVYEQQMARVLGLEVLHMADADVLPYDYPAYAQQITAALERTQKQAGLLKENSLDFASAIRAAQHFAAAGAAARQRQEAATGDLARLNLALRSAESALLAENGLPNRPWYRHLIYAPGEYAGYAAVVIPGVSEALDAGDRGRAAEQLAALTRALEAAAAALEGGV